MAAETEIGNRSPESIVQSIREGDRAAEEELIVRYRRGVTVVLTASARRDAAAIDDLFQETFRIAIEKIRGGALREPARLAGFLCSIARNLAIEHFRKAASRRIAGSPEELSLPSPDDDPLEGALRSERAAIVRRVLSELPSTRDRRILFRFYLAEEEKDAICRDLSLTSLHFNRVLFRARERYRELYRQAAGKRAG